MAGKLYDIDSKKLKSFVESWGGATAVAYHTGTSYDGIVKTIRRGSITMRLADKINDQFGISYDMYKKIEEEPPKEEIQPRITLPEVDNKDIKELAFLLREICNNQLAIYKRLNFLTGEVVRIREGEKSEL